MTDRTAAVLLAAFLALAVITTAHLTMPLLAFGWIVGGATALALAERVGVIAWRTGFRCVPVRRGRTAW